MTTFLNGILTGSISRDQRIFIIVCAAVVLIMSVVALVISISGTPESNTAQDTDIAGMFDTSGEIGKTEITYDMSSESYDADTYYPIIIGKNTRPGDSKRKYLPFRFEVSHSAGDHNHYLQVDAMAGGPLNNDYFHITTSRTHANISSYYIYKNRNESHIVLYVRGNASYFFILDRDLSFNTDFEGGTYEKYPKSELEKGTPVASNASKGLEYFSTDGGQPITSLSSGVFSKT